MSKMKLSATFTVLLVVMLTIMSGILLFLYGTSTNNDVITQLSLNVLASGVPVIIALVLFVIFSLFGIKIGVKKLLRC